MSIDTGDTPLTATARLAGSDSWMVGMDIDNTLVHEGAIEIPEKVVDAVARVRAAGHHAVLASGRSVAGILPVAARLGLHQEWVIASNGAVIARLDPDATGGFQVVEQHTLDVGLVAHAVMPGVQIAVERVGWGYWVTERFPAGTLNGDQEVVMLDTLAARRSPRMILRGPDVALRLTDRVRALGVTVSQASPGQIDITPAAVTKATAAQIVADRLGILRDHAVFVGDAANDIEALLWAGRGVAMGQAGPRVKAAADEVTGSIADLGVVDVLNSLPSVQDAAAARPDAGRPHAPLPQETVALARMLAVAVERWHTSGSSTAVRVRFAGTGPALADCQVWAETPGTDWARRASIDLPDGITMPDLANAGYAFPRTAGNEPRWRVDANGAMTYTLDVRRAAREDVS
ncbi:hypothetical protein GCM10027059_44630 [Myceligenerans halotolerans]